MDEEMSDTLFERILSRENMVRALNRVRRNRGSHGVDGMTVDELPTYLKTAWPFIREELLSGTYTPQSVRRVEIPKPDGGTRLLGIPTVLDRLIQQAIAQILGLIFEERLERLAVVTRGWINYFGKADARTIMEELDKWTRRRLRACLWKQWKRIKTKHDNLVRLGVENPKAWEWANSRKKYWRIAGSFILSTTVTNKFLEDCGYESLLKQYQKCHNA